MTTLMWQELYKAALLELRTEQLEARIETAEVAINERLRELDRIASGSREEINAISDALRSLRALAKSECRPSTLSHADPCQIKAVKL